MRRLLAVLLVLWAVPAWAADHCVRAGATGTGTGADWTNAYTALPSDLVRGDTYYIADGSYAGYIFDDAVDGAKVITLKKATVAAHGPATGWSDTYGDGVATWTPHAYGDTLYFVTDYYVFDGATGGGPGAWESGFGFTFVVTTGTAIVIGSTYSSSHPNVSHLQFTHLEISHTAPAVPGEGAGFYFDPSASAGTNHDITISYCFLHDVGSVNVYVFYSDGLVWEYNKIARNANSEAHHGSMFRFDNGNLNGHVRWSIFEDFVGTGALGFYGTSPATSTMHVYRNVFVHTSGFAGAYGNGAIYTIGASSTSDTVIYHNTFVGLTQAAPCTGDAMFNGTGNVARNNLFYVLAQTAYFDPETTHDYNWFDDAAHSEANGQVGTGNPLTNWTAGDFSLVADTIDGATLGAPYNTDWNGRTGVSRGALQYAGATPTAPTNVRIR